MIIRIFDNVKNGVKYKPLATGAVNYVLSDKDWKGDVRSVKPRVLDGDPFMTKCLDVYAEKYSQPSISGSINFAKGEEITEEQKKQLIADVKETFFDVMEGNTNVLFVEHRDKGNLEIHFIINCLALMDDGRTLYYNPFPPKRNKDGTFNGQDSMTTDLKDTFCKLKNHEFDFKQIVEDPSKTRLTNGEKKARQFNKDDFINLDKTKLDKAIKSLAKDGTVKNRDELLKFLHSNGYKVKTGKDYISIAIKQEDGTEKFSRFRNGIYARNDEQSYKEIKQEFKELKDKPLTEKQVEKLQQKLERIVNIRSEHNIKRFKVSPVKTLRLAKELTPPAQKLDKSSQTDFKPLASRPNVQPQQHKDTPEKTSQNVSNQAELSTAQEKQGKSVGSSSPGTSSTGNESASAQMAVLEARTALANARTPKEQAIAQHRLMVAQHNLERVLAQIEQEKIKQLNRKVKI